MKHVIIKGIGSHVPDCVLSNADLEGMVDTTNEWIITRTGIESRRICLDTEMTSDLCHEAALKALENANISVCDVDLIIVATVTPDMQFPSTACIVQRKLGCVDIPCFDISVACSGFVYAIDVARNFLLNNLVMKNILVIGADKFSSIVDWEDRSTCVLFGDGAGAVVLSRDNTNDDSEPGILDVLIGADGRRTQMLYCLGWGTMAPTESEKVGKRERFVKMEGREVFKEAIKRMCAVMEDILLRNKLTIEDIDCVIPHQANMRIISAIAERIGVPEEKMFINLQHMGNTSAASIPIAIDEAVQVGRIQSGDLILVVSFGAGITWGASLIRWK
ncbi:MAG: ketoacyl-ACP synthase III [Puniceicoccales bacterium]|jgi:3-oxoacyl-[acyl-carrier-protein] synthase-3|nr:ketoacyl-ACP synthase III [Puniceicoccales bacterium]